MDLAENLSNSFQYAKKLFSDFGRLIILIILDIIPFVSWVVVGYSARVLRESPENDAPPKLENYGELFVDGAKVVCVSLIYMLIPLILIGAGIGSFLFGTFMRGDLAGGFALRGLMIDAVGVALVLIGCILAFVMWILLSAGIAHMIKTSKFSKAFAFGEILSMIGKVGWGRYLAWIILVALISILLGTLYSVPVVGWIIFAIMGPALFVFVFRSLGILYTEGTR